MRVRHVWHPCPQIKLYIKYRNEIPNICYWKVTIYSWDHPLKWNSPAHSRRHNASLNVQGCSISTGSLVPLFMIYSTWEVWKILCGRPAKFPTPVPFKIVDPPQWSVLCHLCPWSIMIRVWNAINFEKKKLITSLQTSDGDPVLFYCWASVTDSGLTLKQQWVNAVCLLGISSVCRWRSRKIRITYTKHGSVTGTMPALVVLVTL